MNVVISDQHPMHPPVYTLPPTELELSSELNSDGR